jgi:superfamily II DNA/RNA helicase
MFTSFDTLGLNARLIKGLEIQKITKPTNIQCKAIPLALENKDIIGQSHTGSGKTLAYLIPLFEKIDTGKREMQAIILTPTHELALQIDRQIKLLSENAKIPVTSIAIIGQVNIKKQIEKLREKPHIIVGSTGRIFELIKLRKINAHTVRTIVIDEGDKLLDENNLTGVKDVIKTTMRDRQLMMFSATLNQNTLNTAMKLMKTPEVLQVADVHSMSPTITHMYIVAEQRDKIEILRKLVASIKPEKAIVFVNKSDLIEITSAKLQYHHIAASAIYGTATKEERRQALQGLRNGKIQLLVASDLAARGLDIEGVTHIFNLDLPEDSKEYLHRVGRTGRMGKPGTAISIATKKEIQWIKKYEKDFKIHVEEKVIFKGVIQDPFKRKFS